MLTSYDAKRIDDKSYHNSSTCSILKIFIKKEETLFRIQTKPSIYPSKKIRKKKKKLNEYKRKRKIKTARMIKGERNNERGKSFTALRLADCHVTTFSLRLLHVQIVLRRRRRRKLT